MSRPFVLTGMEEVVDLSHPLSSRCLPYPGDPPLSIRTLANVQDKGFHLSAISSVMHTGTHADAPGHFISGGKMMQQLPLSSWYGHAVVIDARELPVLEPILLDTIRNVQADFVLFHTGWDSHYGDPAYFNGHPVFSEELARQLSLLPIKGIGMDLPGPDNHPHNVHHILLGAGKILLENLTRLERLPTLASLPFMALPLPLNIEASWVRAIAWIPAKE